MERPQYESPQHGQTDTPPSNCSCQTPLGINRRCLSLSPLGLSRRLSLTPPGISRHRTLPPQLDSSRLRTLLIGEVSRLGAATFELVLAPAASPISLSEYHVTAAGVLVTIQLETDR